ncbi:hypothetical protein GCM10009001_27420 [Virgibacillus siamensis]|uniref:Uncharacterized protein n=1 Tax=Virgibacillus siamensis TaxID=480071 RepID=A0ABP3RDS5_9BACI
MFEPEEYISSIRVATRESTLSSLFYTGAGVFYLVIVFLSVKPTNYARGGSPAARGKEDTAKVIFLS